jgi:hypothetical protein
MTGLLEKEKMENLRGSNKQAFKAKCITLCREVKMCFSSFNHEKFCKGPPGYLPMLHSLYLQFCNLFFKCGFYWKPCHPAMIGMEFPSMFLKVKPPKEKKKDSSSH